METTTNPSWYYKDVLQVILTTEAMQPTIQAALYAVITYGFNREAVLKALAEYGAADIAYYKSDWLDLLIAHANIILDDHAITEDEFREFGLLKLLFKIEEGNFYKERLHFVQDIINEQMAHITGDGTITLNETFTTANLQSMFDLSSEQFFSLWNDATPSVKRSTK